MAVSTWFGTEFVPLAITYCLSFAALLIGSMTDLKTREVPDFVTYGLMISGFWLNLLFSVIYLNTSFIINSVIGFLIFFGIAYIMFYSGQWGGGDSKILMGLGAMVGIGLSFEKSKFLLGFFINTLLIGAVYGILWSIFLVSKNKQKFWREFKKKLSENGIVKAKKIIILIFGLLLILLFFIRLIQIKILFLFSLLLVLATFYLWIFVKAVEKSCMHNLVEPSKLTEGDWIVRDIYVNRQYICGPKNLGIDKKQIKKLIELYKKGKVKRILIKEGKPFVPSFLIAFVITLVFGNALILLL